MRGRRAVAVATVLLVGLVAASCGEDDDEEEASPSGAGRPAGAAEVQGVTDSTIKVGGIATLTSPTQINYDGIDDGARALFERVNAEGGVHGRRIEFVGVEDDHFDNAANTEAARRLVEREKVFAVAPVATGAFAGAEVLQRADVPYFGWGVQSAFCKHRQGFGFNGCLVSEDPDKKLVVWPGLIRQAYPDAETFGAISEENQPGPRSVGQLVKGAADFGFEDVYVETAVPYTNVDFTPYVQAILEADPDVMFLVLNGPNAIQMAGRLRASGYEGIITTPTVYDPRVLGIETVAQALEGTVSNYGFAPFEKEGNPGIDRMKADLETYAPDRLLTQPVAAGYLSAALLVAILEEVGPELTYERFYEVTQGGFSFDGDGAIGEITFPEAHDTNPNCGSLSIIRNRTFEVLHDLDCPKP